MTLRRLAASRTAASAFGFACVLLVIGVVEILVRAAVINPFIVPAPSDILAALPRMVVEENVLHRFWQTAQEMLWAALLLFVVGVPLAILLYRFRLLRSSFETWVGALAAAPVVLAYPLFLVTFGRSATTIIAIGFAAGLAPVTWIGFRRGALLRAYMYEFIELLASHLPRKLVRAAEKAETQEEVERILAGFKIPLRDNHRAGGSTL